MSTNDIFEHTEAARTAAAIKVLIGKHCQNWIIYKPLIIADALQFDRCRVGSVNEILAHLLMAIKYPKLTCNLSVLYPCM
jgi:hypothetical protein